MRASLDRSSLHSSSIFSQFATMMVATCVHTGADYQRGFVNLNRSERRSRPQRCNRNSKPLVAANISQKRHCLPIALPLRYSKATLRQKQISTDRLGNNRLAFNSLKNCLQLVASNRWVSSACRIVVISFDSTRCTLLPPSWNLTSSSLEPGRRMPVFCAVVGAAGLPAPPKNSPTSTTNVTNADCPASLSLSLSRSCRNSGLPINIAFFKDFLHDPVSAIDRMCHRSLRFPTPIALHPLQRRVAPYLTMSPLVALNVLNFAFVSSNPGTSSKRSPGTAGATTSPSSSYVSTWSV